MATEHPFAPVPPPTPEEWRRYLRGELSAQDRQRVEQAVEQDPLLRDALEGAELPGALTAMESLSADTSRTGASRNARLSLLIGGVVLTCVGVAWWAWDRQPRSPSVSRVKPAEQPQVTAMVTPEQQRVFRLEVERAVPPPAPAFRQARPVELFIQPQARDTTIVRDEPPAAMSPNPTTLTPVHSPANDVPTPVRGHTTRKIFFVHDLKCVDPLEMHVPDLLLRVPPASVEARFADAEAQRRASGDQRLLRYQDFMEEALGRYVRNDEQGCIEELFFLLDQYPEDVNAQFYAGLCAYELGLYPRAKVYLKQAASHRIDTFKEEAAWYHALAVEGDDGTQEARPLFQQVAQERGFYADRAQRKLSDRAE